VLRSNQWYNTCENAFTKPDGTYACPYMERKMCFLASPPNRQHDCPLFEGVVGVEVPCEVEEICWACSRLYDGSCPHKSSRRDAVARGCDEFKRRDTK